MRVIAVVDIALRIHPTVYRLGLRQSCTHSERDNERKYPFQHAGSLFQMVRAKQVRAHIGKTATLDL